MAVLVQQNVKRTLFTMAFPMLAGTFAMNAYNLTDTWFVSRLGTVPLAAMGFTFPVVMLLTFLARGIGTGVTTLVSHAIGRHDHGDAARLVTHGLTFVLALTVTLSVAGYLTMRPLFSALGADGRTLPLVLDYMGVWYLGAFSMSIPMLGNGILISCGDSRAASRFMILGTLLNAVLDPIMIFGWLGCPAMGIRGAALATVISQAVTTAWLFHMLARKHRLLLLRRWAFAEYRASFRQIVRFAVPSILGMVLMPVSSAIIVVILSGIGVEAVAGASAAGRIEMFAFVIPMALGISLTPFVSQNFGAGRPDRIREALTVSTRFAFIYGAAMACLFFLAAPWLAAIFTRDPKVSAVFVAYVRIIAFGYGMMEVHRYCGFFLTGLHRPAYSMLLNGIRILVLLIPLSYLGARLAGYRGLFFGRLATDLVAGAIGIAWVTSTVRSLPDPAAARPAAS